MPITLPSGRVLGAIPQMIRSFPPEHIWLQQTPEQKQQQQAARRAVAQNATPRPDKE
jgi:hypothetical protein